MSERSRDVAAAFAALLLAYEEWMRMREQAAASLQDADGEEALARLLVASGAWDITVRVGEAELRLSEYLSDIHEHRYAAVLERVKRAVRGGP